MSMPALDRNFLLNRGNKIAMTSQTRSSEQYIYTILNPASGNADMHAVEQAMADLCRRQGWKSEVYRMSGKVDLAEVARQACAQGATRVVAAGGDGTVAGVVNGLIDSGIPLVIVPIGTGNGLARAMKIPLNIEEAVKLLEGEYRAQEIDAMRVNEKHYVLNVSAGISSRAMRETPSEEKKSKGILAYAETILKDDSKDEARIFDLEIDGHDLRVEAVEVLVSNGRILKESPLLFGRRESFSDGQLEVNILRASNLGEFVSLAWDLILDVKEENSKLHSLAIRQQFRMDTPGQPMPVQADGEVIGQAPVSINLVPKAIRVIVPDEKV